MKVSVLLSIFLLSSLTLFSPFALARNEKNKRAPVASELEVIDSTESDMTEDYYQKPPTEDFSRKNMSDILQKFGLNIVPELTNLLDHVDGLFLLYTQDAHFVAMNRVIAAFKNSFLRTLEPVKRSKSQPSGSLEPHTVNELFEVQQKHFQDIIKVDPDVNTSQIEPFIRDYVGHFFETLKSIYEKIYSTGLSLNWTLIFMLLPFVERLPTDLLDRSMFSDVLDVPGQMKQALHDFLSELMSGDQAHFIRMIVTFLSTLDFKRMMQDKSEL
jgi:hypothetical protein